MLQTKTLNKSQRLRTPNDYRRVYQTKQWGGSSHHTFNVNPLEENSLGAFGVTVSKKVSKLAVVRNTIKRQVKEFYRHKQHELNNTELVITAKASCGKASKEQRMLSLESLWVKVIKWQRWQQNTQNKVLS